MGTKQWRGLLAALSGLALSSGIALALLRSSHCGLGPVYAVAEVQAHLADDPQGWVGRAVWVRGRAVACQLGAEQGHVRCMPTPPGLADPAAPTANGPLLLREKPEPLLALLRRVPMLGSLLPSPQAVAWWRVATYRVELRAMTGEPCGDATCYEALLPDAAP